MNNTEDDMFCIKCGTKLQEQPVQKVVEKLYCPVCNTEYTSLLMKCTKWKIP